MDETRLQEIERKYAYSPDVRALVAEVRRQRGIIDQWQFLPSEYKQVIGPPVIVDYLEGEVRSLPPQKL